MAHSKSAKKAALKAAPKATFSFRRHLLPPLIGLVIMVIVFTLLNGQWLMAQAKYRFTHPTPAVATVAKPSSTDTKSPAVSAAPSIIIPKINVNAPVIFEPSSAEWAVQLALRKGVDHYAGTANPGQAGNTVLFGHSSGQLWAPGDYKFVFTLLDKVQPKDQIFVDYNGTRYTYVVTSTEVILPTNLSILNQNSTKPSLTLVTCTPVGTSKYRLVVHADQVSPSPTTAVKPATVTDTKVQPKLPGSAHSSFWTSVTSRL